MCQTGTKVGRPCTSHPGQGCQFDILTKVLEENRMEIYSSYFLNNLQLFYSFDKLLSVDWAILLLPLPSSCIVVYI